MIFRNQYGFVYGVASRISKNNLLQYLNGGFNDYVHVDSSISIRKISQQPIEFCQYVLYGMQQVFSQSVLICITIIAILIYNAILFPLLLLILLPPVFLVSIYMRRKLKSARLHGKTTAEKSIQHLQEALSGFIESNIYQRHVFFTNRYDKFQSKLNHYLAEKQVIQNMPSRLIEVFAVFGLFMLIVLNAFAENSTSIQLVTLGAFMAAAYKVIPGIVRIMNTMSQIKTYSYTMEGLVFKEQKKMNTLQYATINSIEFKKVFFSYPGKKILNEFDLAATKGDMIGISGASGKGKTTIANLLLGFLEPEKGSICINGASTNAEQRQAGWKNIAYIKQQPFFLHDTIRVNVTLQESGHDEAKLKKVTEYTGVHNITTTTADGLETVITEHGKNFSGGQRQRIVFARAMYHDADLLILDEPFNELDEQSEMQMLNELKKLLPVERSFY